MTLEAREGKGEIKLMLHRDIVYMYIYMCVCVYDFKTENKYSLLLQVHISVSWTFKNDTEVIFKYKYYE